MWAIMWADITSSSSLSIHRHAWQITGHRERTTAKQNRKEVGGESCSSGAAIERKTSGDLSGATCNVSKGSDTSERDSHRVTLAPLCACVEPDSAGLIQLFVCTNTSSSSSNNNVIAWSRITGPIRLWLCTRTILVIVACLGWNVKWKAVWARPGGWGWWAEWPDHNNGVTMMNWKKRPLISICYNFSLPLSQRLPLSRWVWALRGDVHIVCQIVCPYTYFSPRYHTVNSTLNIFTRKCLFRVNVILLLCCMLHRSYCSRPPVVSYWQARGTTEATTCWTLS